MDEIKSIINNETWILIDRPKNCKVVGSRIVLQNKFDSSENLKRRKARLVAQGFSQQPGIHYFETFAPVSRIGTIRLMVSLAARYGIKIGQFDVEIAYLNGELEKTVFIKPPKSLENILMGIIDSNDSNASKSKAMNML